MDFDSIVSLILILLFFLFPTLIKQLGLKKKAVAKTREKSKKISLFEKLGEMIQTYVQNIENQGRKPGQAGQGGWEEIEDDQDQVPPGRYADPFDPDAYSEERDFEPSVAPVVRAKKPVSAPEKPRPVKQSAQCPVPAVACLQGEPSFRDLQQAIIWSEILSKPIALRDKGNLV